MDFSVKNIFFQKNHVISPFTTEKHFGDIKLSTLEKVAAIGLSILIGSFTLLIGGVVAFYWITATIKSDKIKQLNLLQRSSVETNQNIDVEPKKTKKKVSFAPDPYLIQFRTYEPMPHEDQHEDGLEQIEEPSV